MKNETALRNNMINNPKIAYTIFLDTTGKEDTFETYKEYRLFYQDTDKDYMPEKAIGWLYSMEPHTC